MVARALPEVRAVASPEQVRDARQAAATAALRRLLDTDLLNTDLLDTYSRTRWWLRPN